MESPRKLWSPSEKFRTESNLNYYLQWLKKHKGLSFDDYHTLWNWSVSDLPAFWESLWQYFDIIHDGTYSQVCSEDPMPHTRWFSGAKLNYAEHIFRGEHEHIGDPAVVGVLHEQHLPRPAIIFKAEGSDIQEISWQELRQQVAALQHFLKQHGVQAGDRIVAYMPCIPEASVALLASASLGAVWSSCSPDFGTNAVIDRFAQIEPKVLIAVDHYKYGGKVFDKTEVVRELAEAMPSLECVVIISEKGNVESRLVGEERQQGHQHGRGVVGEEHQQRQHQQRRAWFEWNTIIRETGHTLTFTRVPFDHPIWVLYSSGTTGLPKAITHSQGGILLEQLKYGTFHNDFKAGERCFWYTTTGWMMWNYIHGSLLAGGTMVLYDGSPAYPDLTALWKFTQDAGIHHFGTSAGFILANLKAGIEPAAQFDLSTLRSISSTGSTLPPEGFDWIYDHVKQDLWLASMSGGTDVCSAFVGGNPLWAVYAGEIQCRALGCRLEAFDDQGKPVTDEVGEMVITAPMPSMPVYFWNDPGFRRYHESYFDMYPGVWRHGDWIRITPRQGVVIYGRSDATLNRGGVRIGTSEIYRAVDKVKEVKDSLILCLEKTGGEFWMPLFVVMHEGQVLNEEIKKKINARLRSEYSPRHVPDEIIAVPDVPYTISGKKTETPVKKVLMGKDPAEVVNAGALRNPSSMEFFIGLAKK